MALPQENQAPHFHFLPGLPGNLTAEGVETQEEGSTCSPALWGQGLKGDQAALSSTGSWLPQVDGKGIIRPAAQDLPGTDLVKGGGSGPTELRAILGA